MSRRDPRFAARVRDRHPGGDDDVGNEGGVAQPIAHTGCIAAAARVERLFPVVTRRIVPARLRVAQNQL